MSGDLTLPSKWGCDKNVQDPNVLSKWIQVVHVVEEPLCRLVVNIGQGGCPSMSSVWTAIVCDPNDLM